VTVVLAIAVHEIRRYLRERIPLFTTIVMPVALVLILGSAYGSAPSAFPVGVLDEDRTALSGRLATALDRAPLTTTSYDDADDLTRDIRLGLLTAGVRIPAGLEEALAGGRRAQVVMTLDQASSDGTAVASAISAATGDVSQVPTAVQAGLAALGRTDVPTRGLLTAVAEQVSEQGAPVGVVLSPVGAVPPERSAFARATYTQLTLFVFLNGMLAGIPLVESRRLGVARRMLSTPTGIGPHILGVGLGRWGIGLIQAALLLGLGAAVFDVQLGHWPTALTIALLWCALGATVGMVLGAVARTPDQVVAWSVPLGIGMGMLGGCMWPLSVVPPFMRTIGHLTPHAWAVDAWGAVVDDGARFGGVALELGVLAATTAVLAVLAVLLLRRSLAR
jgi:ABC-2 type transport system permease protein